MKEKAAVPAIAPATPAARRPNGRDARRRVLVVVDDACTARELCAGVRGFAAEAPIEALVIAPAHGTASTQWYADDDAARADATHRLRTCVTCLAHDGTPARGELSGPDPIQGIEDALHDFAADEILLVTAPRRPSRWLRQSVVERAGRVFRQPITHIAMPTASRTALPVGSQKQRRRLTR